MSVIRTHVYHTAQHKRASVSILSSYFVWYQWKALILTLHTNSRRTKLFHSEPWWKKRISKKARQSPSNGPFVVWRISSNRGNHFEIHPQLPLSRVVAKVNRSQRSPSLWDLDMDAGRYALHCIASLVASFIEYRYTDSILCELWDGGRRVRELVFVLWSAPLCSLYHELVIDAIIPSPLLKRKTMRWTGSTSYGSLGLFRPHPLAY